MRDDSRSRAAVWLLTVAAAWALCALAMAEPPHINVVFPAGGQGGQTVQATITGLDLRAATAVHVSGGGVIGKIVEAQQPATKPAATKQSKFGRQAKETETVRVSIAIAPDAELGVRDLRFVTPGGVSNRYRFVVGQLPEVAEVEPNSTRAQAQRLESLPVVVNGQVFEGDADTYRFTAKSGQTIVCEVHGQRLLPFIADAVAGWLQAELTLYDADGRELMHVDDFRFQPDPVLIYKVEKDGDYLIEIKDALYRGRGDFVYRLSIGALPFITHVYPLGARRNTTASVKLAGANLDKPSLSVAVPDDGREFLSIGTNCGGLATNALPLAVGDLEETSETEDNDSPHKANRVKPGTTVNGRVQKPGDADCFVFTAEAKQTLVIPVHARRLGSPLDPILAVFDANGKELAQNDDAVDERQQTVTHHADSQIVHTFPAAGDYVVSLRDVQGKGGDEYAYRLSIAPPRPDFALRVLPDNGRIAPGDTAVLTAAALRTDGLDGEIKLTVQGLAKGFVTRGAAIPAKEAEARFSVTAPADVPPGLLSPSLSGAAQVADRTVTRPAMPVEEVQQAFSTLHRVPTAELLLAVTEPPPFALTTDLAADGVVEVPRGGQATLTVKTTRREGTKGQIRLAVERPPRNITVQASAIPDGQNEAVLTLRASNQAAVGFTQNVILTGTMTAGKETTTPYAPAVPIRVVSAPALWSVDLPASSDGVEALDGWAVDESWSRPGKLSITSEKGRGKVMEIACEGDEGKKLALALIQNMDISKATHVEVVVGNATGATVKVSVAFGAAPEWKMHETPAAEVPSAKDPARVRFRLDQPQFKSEVSGWKHTQPMPNGGQVDKMLIIVEGLPKTARITFDAIRFGASAPGQR